MMAKEFKLTCTNVSGTQMYQVHELSQKNMFIVCVDLLILSQQCNYLWLVYFQLMTTVSSVNSHSNLQVKKSTEFT